MDDKAAYLKAEARGFAPDVELQDWLEADKEVWGSWGVPIPPSTRRRRQRSR